MRSRLFSLSMVLSLLALLSLERPAYAAPFAPARYDPLLTEPWPTSPARAARRALRLSNQTHGLPWSRSWVPRNWHGRPGH